MSATEKLRALLDERDARWTACSKATMDNQTFCNPYTFTEFQDGLMVSNLTPEQAIAATLGGGTCTVTRDSNCSNCGKQIGVVRNCEMYETCDGRQAWKPLDHEVCDVPNYCPNCGAKVERREQ